jgi:hypothetical protein
MKVLKFFKYLYKWGPLLTMVSVCNYMQSHFSKIPGCKKLFSSIDWNIKRFQYYLDKKYDKKYGVDTSGVIQAENLEGKNKNVEFANRYEPTSVNTFYQIMNQLPINFREFTFIDFGSGRGRVLLLASNYGFKKIIGVEFDTNLHLTANNNIQIYKSSTKNLSDIESVCEDATRFSIPGGQLVIFFFSPFRDKVMSQVLSNISKSFSVNKNRIIVIFYGSNPKIIELFASLNFKCTEFKLGHDWSRLFYYRCLVFESPEGL